MTMQQVLTYLNAAKDAFENNPKQWRMAQVYRCPKEDILEN